MKKLDGRSKAARAKKEIEAAKLAGIAAAAQYESNMKQNADGSFHGQTGKQYKAMEFSVDPMPDTKHEFVENNREQYAEFLHACAYDRLNGYDDDVPELKKARHYLDTLITVLSGGPL